MRALLPSGAKHMIGARSRCSANFGSGSRSSGALCAAFFVGAAPRARLQGTLAFSSTPSHATRTTAAGAALREHVRSGGKKKAGALAMPLPHFRRPKLPRVGTMYGLFADPVQTDVDWARHRSSYRHLPQPGVL